MGLMMTAYDAYDNIATGYRGTVHFSSSDPAASLPADYTFVSGVSPYLYVTLETLGDQTVTATDTVHPTINRSAIVWVESDDQ